MRYDHHDIFPPRIWVFQKYKQKIHQGRTTVSELSKISLIATFF